METRLRRLTSLLLEKQRVGGALFRANADHSIQVRLDLFKWHQYQVAGPCYSRSSVWGVPCSKQTQTAPFRYEWLIYSSGISIK